MANYKKEKDKKLKTMSIRPARDVLEILEKQRAVGWNKTMFIEEAVRYYDKVLKAGLLE